MKRLIPVILLFLLCHLVAAQGSLPAIHDVSTRVYLIKNGNAVISQTWDVTVTGGTEWYIPIDNPGERVIRDLSVFEGDLQFESDGRKWDSDRSLEEKLHRCGIVEKRKGAVELCWGQGYPGRHVFVITYVIEDLVESFDEGDGFHWHFLNSDWTTPPQHASLRIKNETEGPEWYFNTPEDANTRAWAFGFKGNVSISNGEIYIETDEPFVYDDFMSVLLQFDKGLFQPRNEAEESFETLQTKAFNNDFGDDEDPGLLATIIAWVFIAGIIGAVLYFIYKVLFAIAVFFTSLYRHVTDRMLDKKYFGKSKITSWSRDVPLGGSLTAAYSLLKNGDDATNGDKAFENMVGAYFLRWILDGIISVEKDPGKEGRMILKLDKSLNDAVKSGGFESELYSSTLQAAGGNNLLEANEFAKWSEQHFMTVGDWPATADKEGQAVWRPLDFTERGRLIEFRNYLRDFTLSSEREAPQVILWKQYLVYAQLFGIADKVNENFAKLYPELAGQLDITSILSTAGGTAHSVIRSASERMSVYQRQNSLSSRSSRQGSYTSYSSRSGSYSSRGGGGSSSYRGGGGGHGGGRGGGSR